MADHKLLNMQAHNFSANRKPLGLNFNVTISGAQDLLDTEAVVDHALEDPLEDAPEVAQEVETEIQKAGEAPEDVQDQEAEIASHPSLTALQDQEAETRAGWVLFKLVLTDIDFSIIVLTVISC